MPPRMLGSFVRQGIMRGAELIVSQLRFSELGGASAGAALREGFSGSTTAAAAALAKEKPPRGNVYAAFGPFRPPALTRQPTS